MIVRGVLVSVDVAEELASLGLRRHALDLRRRDGVTLSDDAWRILDEFDRVATTVRQAGAAVARGGCARNRPEVASAHDAGVTYVTVAEAAERTGRKRQSIERSVGRRTVRSHLNARGRRVVALEDILDA